MISSNRQPRCDGQPTAAETAPCCCGSTEKSRFTPVDAAAAKPATSRWNSFTSLLLSLGVVFFPKCPLCWAAYMSLFSFLGFEAISYQPWMLPVMIFLLLLNLVLLGYATMRRRVGPGPLALSLIGVALALGGKFLLDQQPVIYGGLAFMLMGTVWNAIPVQVNGLLRYLKDKINALLPTAQKEIG